MCSPTRTSIEAIAMQNGVDQGLSSAIFTNDVRESMEFLNPDGSGTDCGMAYVNLAGPPARRSAARSAARKDRRRARIRLGFVEGVHAPADNHRELRLQLRPCTGDPL
jgi:hypothetical protein